MEDEAEPNPIVPTPWCLFGFFLGIQKEARRRGGEIPSSVNEPNLRMIRQ